MFSPIKRIQRTKLVLSSMTVCAMSGQHSRVLLDKSELVIWDKSGGVKSSQESWRTGWLVGYREPLHKRPWSMSVKKHSGLRRWPEQSATQGSYDDTDIQHKLFPLVLGYDNVALVFDDLRWGHFHFQKPLILTTSIYPPFQMRTPSLICIDILKQDLYSRIHTFTHNSIRPLTISDD